MYLIGANIITPLGEGVQQNFEAVMQGEVSVKLHHDKTILPDPFYASLFDDIPVETFANRFEALCVRCAKRAVEEAQTDTTSERVIFILSTTKGNIEALNHTQSVAQVGLADSARRIALCFGNNNTSVVVSNACTSGVCAQILAMRLLRAGLYDTAVVIGADVQSEFIISGFQCLKALSDEPCRPYDAARKGLNLGEAAACMVISNKAKRGSLELLTGAVCNDANHISGPSRTAEGSWRVLDEVTKNIDKQRIGVVNAHGTATLYNDEMESLALWRAGLQNIPVNSLKSVFGHTMGAAGILETLLTHYAMTQGIVLPTRNFETAGTTHSLKVSRSAQAVGQEKDCFVKLLSGFGGCNAALVYKLNASGEKRPAQCSEVKTEEKKRIVLSSDNTDLIELYHRYAADYPKFLKMDVLSKVGFMAAEMLARQQPLREDCSVLIFTHSGSLQNDLRYQQTIGSFPSPALFVYTLPNIVTGEIAIRHHLLAETSCYLLPEEDWTLMQQIAKATFCEKPNKQMLCGWVETGTDTFYADMRLIERL